MSRPPGADLRIAVVGADGAACADLARSLSRHRPHAAALAATPPLASPFDLTLLCAQDCPGPAEITLRTALAQAGVAFQVLYGPPQAQLRSALEAIDLIAASAFPASAGASFHSENSRRQRLRAWGCEKCGDPECEHRLFTALRDS